ncbi:hypothetical protein [Synechococcus sp. CCY 9618]|uniref:hypothetical protein n=1 Tax=Synechococcus sp. CCY 9618 TaxID=2815602 RepID=UPI001C24216F|nr:hypothetical protein [Synechococcus sp. CCY 9618]
MPTISQSGIAMKLFTVLAEHDCAVPAASRLRATQSTLGFIPTRFGELAGNAIGIPLDEASLP